MNDTALYARPDAVAGARRRAWFSGSAGIWQGLVSVPALCLVALFVVSRPTVGLALALSVALLAVIAAMPARRWLILVLIPVALLPGSTYGSVRPGFTLFSRGGGILGFPAFDVAIMVLGFTAWARSHEPGTERQRSVLARCVFLITALYVIRAIAEPMAGTSLRESFSGDGGRLLLVLGAAFLLTVSTMRRLSDVQETVRAMALLGVLVAALGMFRFAFFGGDSSNPYHLYSHVDVKLTFFEGTYAIFLAVSIVWALAGRMGARASGSRQWWWLASGCLALVTLLLTYRRTNWIALLVAGAVVAVVSNRRRWAVLLLLGITFLSVGSLSSARALEPRLAGAGEGARWSEMRLAVAAIKHYPLGQGTQGRYQGTPGYGWPAPPTVVHDSFLWIGLKLGVPGMALLAVAFVAAGVGSIRTARRDFEYRQAGVVLASMGAFWLVNLLFGTPLLETRYAVVFGVWLGLVAQYQALQRAHERNAGSSAASVAPTGGLRWVTTGSGPLHG
jgi:hypothetical protein